MAHQTEIVINGVTTEVTEFDHTAQEIDDTVDNLNTLTGGATTKQAALANLGAGVRPSLLHNGLFIGGGTAGNLPVNQRGQTSYTAGGYTVDRWRMAGSAAKITVQADGIYYEKTADATSYGIWEQKLPLGELEGKELTASVLVDDVCYSDTIAAGWTYSNGTVLKQFFINNGSKQMMISVICDADNILIFRFYYGGSAAAATTGFLLQAAKLEEGDTQTLAYQDEDGAWQLLPQPESDYATQLAKCQRYFRSFNAWTKFEADYIDANRVSFSIPGDMRIDPTVTGDWGVYTGFTLQNGFVLEGHRTGSNLVVVASKESHGLTTAWLGVKDNSFGYLNADL